MNKGKVYTFFVVLAFILSVSSSIYAIYVIDYMSYYYGLYWTINDAKIKGSTVNLESINRDYLNIIENQKAILKSQERLSEMLDFLDNDMNKIYLEVLEVKSDTGKIMLFAEIRTGLPRP